MHYNFDEIIDRHHTNAVNIDGYVDYLFDDTVELKLNVPEDELIKMWIADMDFATPDFIIESIKGRLNKQILGYSMVFENDYFTAFSTWLRQNHNLNISKDVLTFSHGIIEALELLVSLICNKNDKVLILTPSYSPFQIVCDKNNISTVYSQLKNNNGYYEIDYEDIKNKLAQENIKLCIFCNPHNPTGRAWNKDELKHFMSIMKAHDIWVVSDEIHCDIKRKSTTHTPLSTIFPEYDKVITTMSQSKAFNIAGLMFSNVIIPHTNLMQKWQEKQSLYVNPLSIAATQSAYEQGEQWLAEMNNYIEQNFIYLKEYLNKQLPYAEFAIPESTYLAWIDLSYYLHDIQVPTAQFFIEQAGIVLEGAEQFLDNANGHIRLNVAVPRQKLTQALNRITQVLSL